MSSDAWKANGAVEDDEAQGPDAAEAGASAPTADPGPDPATEVAALKDQALRYAAEAENTRRRAEREINDARAFAIQGFAKDLLGVADNLARALEHAPREGEDSPARSLAVGLEMTQKALTAAFERNGLKAISPAVGEKFDPHRQQAMMEQASSEVAPGGVIQTLQTGYELFGRVVRPAMVVVAARDSTGTGREPAGPEAGRG